MLDSPVGYDLDAIWHLALSIEWLQQDDALICRAAALLSRNCKQALCLRQTMCMTRFQDENSKTNVKRETKQSKKKQKRVCLMSTSLMTAWSFAGLQLCYQGTGLVTACGR